MTKTGSLQTALLISLSLLTIAALLAAGNDGQTFWTVAKSFHPAGIWPDTGATGLVFVWAFGHCDGLDGPVVTLARKALDSGNVNLVLPWVRAEDETEIRRSFDGPVFDTLAAVLCGNIHSELIRIEYLL